MHDRKITIDIVLTVEGEDPITVRASPTEEHLCLPFHDFAVRYLEMPIMVLKQRIGIDPETGMADLMLRRSAPPAVMGIDWAAGPDRAIQFGEAGSAPPAVQVGEPMPDEPFGCSECDTPTSCMEHGCRKQHATKRAGRRREGA